VGGQGESQPQGRWEKKKMEKVWMEKGKIDVGKRGRRRHITLLEENYQANEEPQGSGSSEKMFLARSRGEWEDGSDTIFLFGCYPRRVYQEGGMASKSPRTPSHGSATL